MTGVATDIANGIGVSTFYVNGIRIGSVDRVASGDETYFIAADWGYPGYVAVAGVLNTAIDAAHITALDSHIRNEKTSTGCMNCPIGKTSNAGIGQPCDVCSSGYGGNAVDDGVCSACGVGTYKSSDGNSQCITCNIPSEVDCGNLISNSAFDNTIINSNTWKYMEDQCTEGWCYLGDNNNANRYVALMSHSTEWNYAIPYPTPGTQAVSIQSLSSVFQDVYIIAGKYSIDWNMIGRHLYGANPIILRVQLMSSNSILIEDTFVAASNLEWEIYTLEFTVLEEAYYRIHFIGASFDDKSSAIKNIRLLNNDCQATSISGCYANMPSTCAPGYGGSATTSCDLCELGISYKVDVGDGTCTSCIANTVDCGGNSPGQCAAGYGGSATTSCVLCAPGVSYKASGGNIACSSCAMNTDGCGEQNVGQCALGYYGYASDTCSACQSGKYKNSIGDGEEISVCTPCALGLYSNIGSTGCNLCAAGYTGDPSTGSCSACPGGMMTNPGINEICTPIPSSTPSSQPSGQPSMNPTGQPTGEPSSQPTDNPTSQPTNAPSGRPTAQPTIKPSSQPSSQPSGQPSMNPTGQPTGEPSSQPTDNPSSQPTNTPSGQPSGSPSVQPTVVPTGQPSNTPTSLPTVRPSGQPSSVPSTQPTVEPSGQPSLDPSAQPTARPSSQPSGEPSGQPSLRPTSQPSCSPSSYPTHAIRSKVQLPIIQHLPGLVAAQFDDQARTDFTRAVWKSLLIKFPDLRQESIIITDATDAPTRRIFERNYVTRRLASELVVNYLFYSLPKR